MEGDALVSGTSVQGANDRSTGSWWGEARAPGPVMPAQAQADAALMLPGIKKRWKTRVQLTRRAGVSLAGS
jgi:hypothetical protein